jgi:hypothetical protein
LFLISILGLGISTFFSISLVSSLGFSSLIPYIGEINGELANLDSAVVGLTSSLKVLLVNGLFILSSE